MTIANCGDSSGVNEHGTPARSPAGGSRVNRPAITRRASVWAHPPAGGFCHQVLHYRGAERFFHIVAAFARQGAARAEPVLLMVGAAKLTRLRDLLAEEVAAGQVELVDMDVVGANPARIIPAWREFVDRHPGSGPLRGVGEPIGPSRQGDALEECTRHEELLNVAFGHMAGDDRPFWLLCPYDLTALDPVVVRRSRRTHPFTIDDAALGHADSPDFDGVERFRRPSADTLPPAPANAWHLRVTSGDATSLRRARRAVADLARLYGMAEATEELVLAAHEVLANAVVHGGGEADVAAWLDDAVFVCEVTDRGELADPLAGRRAVPAGEDRGRGLWMANQLCDLVQVRQIEGCTVVRLQRRRPGGSLVV